MKRIPVFLVLFLAGSWTLLSQNQAQRVVLISIDGLAAFHLEDRNLELPHIRELIGEGVWAEYSEGVFPTVTHPSHTSLLTGVHPRKHGVVGNRVRNRQTGESFHITNLPRTESVQVETLFDAAKRKGLTTAALFWPETKDDPAIDWNIAEVFDAEGNADIDATSPELIAELQEAGIPIHLYFEWYSREHLRGAGDIILAEAGAYLIDKYEPEFMAAHFLATDVMQHYYGPEHYLAQNALTVVDRCVGILQEAVRKKGLADETVFIITGDHGFNASLYNLNLAPLFEELAGKLDFGGYGWFLFVDEGEDFDPSRDAPVLQETLDEVAEVPGITRVYSSEEFPTLGLPKYEENPLISGKYLILADSQTHLRVDPEEPPFLRRVLKDEPYYGHGYLPSHPTMHTGFVVSGSGIRSGVRIGPVRHVDVAPTVTEILGLELSGVDGEVLRQIFRD